MEKYLEAYMELYKATNISKGYRLNKQIVHFNQLSHFVGMKGKRYDEQEVRLLVVGRAVNGWGQLDSTSAESFSADAMEKVINDKFKWIVCDNETLRNDCKDENGEYYWLNDSPFWRTSRRIWMNLSGNDGFVDKNKDKWVDYIAWTNLYKVAPRDTGNPTTTMSKQQLNACKKILQAEIEKFKPTHILFITGYEWWFESFKDIFDVDFYNIKKNEYRGEKKNRVFAEASLILDDKTKIVVACRPECRDENLYINDVACAFKELDNL